MRSKCCSQQQQKIFGVLRLPKNLVNKFVIGSVFDFPLSFLFVADCLEFIPLSSYLVVNFLANDS